MPSYWQLMIPLMDLYAIFILIIITNFISNVQTTNKKYCKFINQKLFFKIFLYSKNSLILKSSYFIQTKEQLFVI